MNKIHTNRFVAAVALFVISLTASAQKYQNGVVDKTVAVIGNEVILISQLEEEVNMMKAYGMVSDKTGRCEILEQMMVSKLFLMQARVDSLKVNNDMVETNLTSNSWATCEIPFPTTSMELSLKSMTWPLAVNWEKERTPRNGQSHTSILPSASKPSWKASASPSAVQVS